VHRLDGGGAPSQKFRGRPELVRRRYLAANENFVLVDGGSKRVPREAGPRRGKPSPSMGEGWVGVHDVAMPAVVKKYPVAGARGCAVALRQGKTDAEKNSGARHRRKPNGAVF
jgi:hypothetical protein